MGSIALFTREAFIQLVKKITNSKTHQKLSQSSEKVLHKKFGQYAKVSLNLKKASQRYLRELFCNQKLNLKTFTFFLLLK